MVSKPPGRRGRRRAPGRRRRRWAPRSSSRCWAAGQPDLTAAAEAVLRRLGRDVPDLAACGGAARRRPSGRAAARPVRRRHPVRRGDADRHRRARPGPQQHPAVPGARPRRRPRRARRGRAHDGRLRRRRLHRRPGAPDDRPDACGWSTWPGPPPTPAPACSCSTSSSATAPSPTRRPLLAPALAGVRASRSWSRVVGTAADPQGRDRQVAALAEAGAEVHLSNAGATRRAVELLGGARDDHRPRPSSPSAPTCSPTRSPTRPCRRHPRRLAPADARHRGRPGHRRRRPAAPRRQRAGARSDARRPGDAWSTSLPASRGARARARPVPARRARRSPGTAPPGRCAAR